MTPLETELYARLAQRDDELNELRARYEELREDYAALAACVFQTSTESNEAFCNLEELAAYTESSRD